MLDAVIAQLRCPVCAEPLTVSGGSLVCARRHSFDIARQGYVDLTAGRSAHQGDTADMIAAREAVHAAGHLDPVLDAVAGQVRPTDRFLVEVGAGTGSYLARALDAAPDRNALDASTGRYGLAVDVSKAALRRAARAHPRMAAVRADIWRGLPLAAGSVDVVLDVFAPRSGPEFARVLSERGTLIVAAAEPGHLAELTGPLGLLAVDPDKPGRLRATLEPWLWRAGERLVSYPRKISRIEAATLIAMGPSARHVGAEELTARLDGLPEPIEVTVAVRVSTWRKTQVDRSTASQEGGSP